MTTQHTPGPVWWTVQWTQHGVTRQARFTFESDAEKWVRLMLEAGASDIRAVIAKATGSAT